MRDGHPLLAAGIRHTWVLVFSATFLAALIARRLSSSAGAFAVLLWVAGVVVLAAMDAWEVATAPKWLAGLHRVAPYLVFALLPAPAKGRNDGWPPYAMVAATAVYVGRGDSRDKYNRRKVAGPPAPSPCCRSCRRGDDANHGPASVRGARASWGTLESFWWRWPPLFTWRERSRLSRAQPRRCRSSSRRPGIKCPGDRDGSPAHGTNALARLSHRKVIFLADSHEARAKLGRCSPRPKCRRCC